MNPDISPCANCPNHLAGVDKRLCLDNCKKLKAFQIGKDYTNEEVYIVAEGKDLVEDIGGDGADQPDAPAFEESDEFEETEEIIDGDELPGQVKHIPPVRPVRPEPNWKKTINPKTAENSKKCAICGKPESHDNKFLRGVCRKPCYNQWYQGAVEHPVLGKFKRAPREEVEYPAGDLNKPEPKTHSIPETDKDICEQTATINMDNYPLIKVAVYRMAVKLSLPVSHIIITLIAEALENRRADRG